MLKLMPSCMPSHVSFWLVMLADFIAGPGKALHSARSSSAFIKRRFDGAGVPLGGSRVCCVPQLTRSWSLHSHLWSLPGGSTPMLMMPWWHQQPTARPWRLQRPLSATSSTALCTAPLLLACTQSSANSQILPWTASCSRSTTVLLWITCVPPAPPAAFKQPNRARQPRL